MSAHNDIQECGLRMLAERTDRTLLVDIPSRIFSPLAEQLRWDSLRAGNLRLEDWSGIKAFASLDSADESEDAELVITLVQQDGNRICRRHSIADWQGLALFAQSTLSNNNQTGSGQAYKIGLRWSGNHDELGLAVPLSPLCIPVEKVQAPSKPTSKPGPLKVFVTKDVSSALTDLAEQSLKHEVEVGGCLLGRMPDLDNIVITEAACASKAEASEGQFSFDPRFWLDVNTRSVGTGTKILGWFHSHLCDNGYPTSLSSLDILVFHAHFVAPWSVGALICASADESEVKWFGWQDGCVVPVAAAETESSQLVSKTPKGVSK